jgi:hypothetical protein
MTPVFLELHQDIVRVINNNLFSQLYTTVFLTIILEWIDLKTLGIVDSAFCNTCNRQEFLAKFRSSGCVIPCKNKKFMFYCESFILWVSLRQMKLRSIEISNLSPVRLVNYVHSISDLFDFSNTSEITLINLNLKFDLANLLNRTTKLTKLVVDCCHCLDAEVYMVNTNSLVLQRITSLEIRLDGNVPFHWQSLFDLVLPGCVDMVALTLSGSGLEQVNDYSLMHCMDGMNKLESLYLDRPIGNILLGKICSRTPKLRHFTIFMVEDNNTEETWAYVAQLFQSFVAITADTKALSPLHHISNNSRSVLQNENISFVTTTTNAPNLFFTNSMNLLSITFGTHFLLLPGILKDISGSNQHIRHLNFECSCVQVSIYCMIIFLKSMLVLDTVIFKTLSHLSSTDLMWLLCNLNNVTSLRKLHVTFCMPLTVLQVANVVHSNPQLEVLEIGNSTRYLKGEMIDRTNNVNLVSDILTKLSHE